MKKIFALFSALLLLCGCAAEPDYNITTRTDFLLDTFVTVTLYGSPDSAPLDGALELCRYYDNMLDRFSPDSEVYRLNHSNGEPVDVSDELAELLEIALNYCRRSGGAYDITIAPVMDLWNFQAEEPALSAPPDSEAVARALEHVDYRSITLSGNTVSLAGGAMVDLGSIAKGFIADKMGQYLREQGVTGAIINLGGNVLTVGGKPNGKPFDIGIQKPFETRQEIVGSVRARDVSLVSSGIYERYFIHDSVLYHHILDARNGYPADSELLSVTIAGPRSADCDALSTLCFLLGPDKGMEFIEGEEGVEAVFIGKDGAIVMSSGFEKNYRYKKA